jgi:hypothetical protein
MFAMEDGLVVAVVIVVDFGRGRCGVRLGVRNRLPVTVAHPGTLFLGGVFDVEEAYCVSVLLELVFDFAGEGEGLGTGEVDGGVLESLAVIDGDGYEAAGFGFAGFAGPLEDGDSAEVGDVFGFFGDLAGVLGEDGKGHEEGQDGGEKGRGGKGWEEGRFPDRAAKEPSLRG